MFTSWLGELRLWRNQFHAKMAYMARNKKKLPWSGSLKLWKVDSSVFWTYNTLSKHQELETESKESIRGACIRRNLSLIRESEVSEHPWPTRSWRAQPRRGSVLPDKTSRRTSSGAACIAPKTLSDQRRLMLAASRRPFTYQSLTAGQVIAPMHSNSEWWPPRLIALEEWRW